LVAFVFTSTGSYFMIGFGFLSNNINKSKIEFNSCNYNYVLDNLKFLALFISLIYIECAIYNEMPVTVAERSKACTVFARSKAGTVVSNPTQGMDV
jgi:hypothetical protein